MVVATPFALAQGQAENPVMQTRAARELKANLMARTSWLASNSVESCRGSVCLARFACALRRAIKKGHDAHTFSPREKVPCRGG